MIEAIYILCALTSFLCMLLLLRGYFRSGARLLLWSGLCFAGLAVNNLLLFVDKILFPETDIQFFDVNLSIWRSVAALVGLLLLLYGMIWDTE
jgi:hypothetical protein